MKKHDYNRLSLLEDRLVRVKSRDIEILVQRIFTKWNWYFISTLICSRNFTRASFHFSISNFEFFKKKIINQKLSESISRSICSKNRIDRWFFRNGILGQSMNYIICIVIYTTYHMVHMVCIIMVHLAYYMDHIIWSELYIEWQNSTFPVLYNLINCMTKKYQYHI